MSEQKPFHDSLEDLMKRHQSASGDIPDTVTTTPDPVNISSDQTTEEEQRAIDESFDPTFGIPDVGDDPDAGDDDEFGIHDMEKEIALEEQQAAVERAQRVAEARQARDHSPAVVMPPQSLDPKYQADAIGFQTGNVEIVTRMIQQVVQKHNLTTGGIPVSTDSDPDLRMHVMGELMECYHDDGEIITERFENIILSNWEGYIDPNLREDQGQTPVSDTETAQTEKTVGNTGEPAQINITVEKGNPVTVNVDKDVVANMTTTNRVDIVVTEVSEQQLLSSRVVLNSQKEGIITPYEYTAYDSPITLPLSAYRCALKPVNYWEFIQLGSSPVSGSRADTDKKQWSIIYDHIKNVSIGEFENFEDFLKKTKYADRELLMWGVLIASAEDEEEITIRCGNPKCGKSHHVRYNPRTLIHVNDELIGKYEWTTTGKVAPGPAAVEHYNKINSTIRRYKLPNTEYIVEIDDRPSAYDFITRRYPLMDALHDRFDPNGEISDEELQDNAEYSYLLIHAMFITAISKVIDNQEYRYTNWDDIERIITTSLDMHDAAILMQLVQKQAAANISPIQFYLEDFNCDSCGRHEDRIMIPDIGNSLIFQLSRRLSSTEINLIEMEST